jgi:uncharacterized protein YecT (DUF1311 family)
MGDRVIGSRPSSVQQVGTPAGSKPPAAKVPFDPMANPAAKAVLDDVVTVNKPAGGAIPAIDLPDPEPDFTSDFESQADMTLQASRLSADADAKLNEAYQAFKVTLDKPAAAKLVTAEKAWIKFRDAEAEFSADSERGGSLSRTVYYGTLTNLTEQRTTDLNGWKAMRETAGPNGPAAAQAGAAERAKVADKTLNVAYKKVAATQDPEGKAKLLTAQKAWLAFRDAECAFAGPAMKDATLAELTEARTTQLQEAIIDR